MAKRCQSCGMHDRDGDKCRKSRGTLIARLVPEGSEPLLAVRTLLGMFLFSSFVAVATAQSTRHDIKQQLRQSLGQGGSNAQLVAQLKQHPELEFLGAHQGMNLFLKKNTISAGPPFSKGVVMAIYQNVAIVRGQRFIGSEIELQIRCASREYRAVKETALNAELKLVEGVIAPAPGSDFARFGPGGLAYQLYPRLCATYETEQAAAAQRAASERAAAERSAAARAAAKAAAQTDAAQNAASSRAAETAGRPGQPATSAKGQSARPRASGIEEPQKSAPTKPRSPMDL